MKNARHLTIGTIIILSCLLVLAFAEDITKVIQAAESNARIFYNGKEISLGTKALSYNGTIYLPASSLENISNRSFLWNFNENKLIISDKPNAEAESLKKELEEKDKSITGLKETIKGLQQELSVEKVLTIKGLQDKLNSEFESYNDLSLRILLSGNEDEVRAKIVVDLSEDSSIWRSLSSSKKTEFVQAVSSSITNEYSRAKISGFVKDISKSNKLLIFYNSSSGGIKTGYVRSNNPITVMEDKFNDDYDTYFSGICLLYNLTGSENKMDIQIGIDASKYESQWGKLSDYRVSGLMSKIAAEITAQYKDCEISGIIYDINTGEELASCSKSPEEKYSFIRNK